MPGIASCRLACSGEYRGKYSINSGLGPTRLRSPRSTFHNCGNSSTLEDRKNLPMAVSRSASGNMSPLALRLSIMVRNLSNVKGLSNRPGLRWRNSIGLPIDNQTNMHTPRNRGERRISPQDAAVQSKILLIQSRNPVCLPRGCRASVKGRPGGIAKWRKVVCPLRVMPVAHMLLRSLPIQSRAEM